MRILLDTNIIIHREAATVVRSDIGVLFRWFDRLHHEKCVHPLTIEEIEQHKDPRVVESFRAKIDSYHTLRTLAPDLPAIEALKLNVDRTANDRNDSALLNELAQRRVDVLVTEDRNIHRKARDLELSLRVFTIDNLLEKFTSENPELADYQVLSVRKEYFGNMNLGDHFFDSFRDDYPDFDAWFTKKSDETAYYCQDERGNVVAFLYVKPEGPDENYSDIRPAFSRKKRLKIGTLKVVSNGFKIGERFIKIIFDNAILFDVDEIYVTAFDKGENHLRLIQMLMDWGFVHHGTKVGSSGEELVLCRPCTPEYANAATTPRLRYPYASRDSRKWIVPIYPEYHTELFPDSVLRTESPMDFIENAPNRNAISKVYISRSFRRDLTPGDIIVFYRTASGGPAWYTSVATTIGVVQSVITNIATLEAFIGLCRKRSVFSDAQLAEHWNYRPNNRPFVVNFLYLYSLPRRMNRKELVESGVLGDDPPRGFEPLSDEQFDALLGGSNVDRRIIVN
jgi:predicted nucleic acid-binding protein